MIWRYHLLRLFLGIVWRQYDVEPDGSPWRLSWSLSWEVANIMCNPGWRQRLPCALHSSRSLWYKGDGTG